MFQSPSANFTHQDDMKAINFMFDAPGRAIHAFQLPGRSLLIVAFAQGAQEGIFFPNPVFVVASSYPIN